MAVKKPVTTRGRAAGKKAASRTKGKKAAAKVPARKGGNKPAKKAGTKPAAKAPARKAKVAAGKAQKGTARKVKAVSRKAAAKAPPRARRAPAPVTAPPALPRPEVKAPAVTTAPPPPARPVLVIPPADYQPSGAELTGVGQPLLRLADAIINGRTIEARDVETLLHSFHGNGGPTAMQVWLLWRSFAANTEQFTSEAARAVGHFLTEAGVPHRRA